MIDESLVLFKGGLSFKQYIPSKRHRFGLKNFVLCDCESGIILDIIVYSASKIDILRNDPCGISGAIVKKLVAKYMDKSDILYTDNWYFSPSLLLYLQSRKTGSCGTIRKNRKYFPKFEAAPRGTCKLKQSGKLLAVTWNDKIDICMVTTKHKGQMINSGKVNTIMKPDCVVDYNKTCIWLIRLICKLVVWSVLEKLPSGTKNFFSIF